MRILSVIAILFFLSSGLFAQTKQQQALTPATTQKITNSPEQNLIGRWTLKSAAGQTQIDGAAIQGYIIFGMDNTFKGVMMGDEGNGTYQVITKDNQQILEVIEKGVVSSIIIQSLTATELVLLADGAELVFTK